MDVKKNLQALRSEVRLGGGQERIDKQHEKGKMTARERIEAFLDPGSFHEIGSFVTHHASGFGMEKQHPWGDGVVTGWGNIDDRQVAVFAQDFTVMGGSVGRAHGRKIAALLAHAVQNGIPVVGLNDSGGARIQEGVEALAGYGDIFHQNVQASGVVPQITVIMGPCAGGAVYSPAIGDFVFMVDRTANMFITGPEVVNAVTHESVDAEALGGAGVHSTRSGVAHFFCTDEENALSQVRWLLSFLPANNLTPPPSLKSTDDPCRNLESLHQIVPENPQHAYDVHAVIEALVDDGEFLEVQREYARNVVVGFARLAGNPVGVVANQPDHLAGVIDINASDKAARFIRFCDAFHFPLVTLVDTPGFLPGIEQEHGGVIRHGAKLIYAYSEATTPKVAVILRKAYGGAYIVMSSKHLGSDLNYAWPGAEIAVMGPEGAVKIVFRRELQESRDAQSMQDELTQRYREELAAPLVAASHGYIDDVIKAQETRKVLIDGLDYLKNKRKSTPARKHGNIPL